MSTNQRAGKAWFHVDMDGLDAIYRAHNQAYSSGRDEFYTSAVANSIRFFDEQGITATYFLIAKDLDDSAKREAVQQIVAAGHNIASHTVNHRYLMSLSSAEKREEIFASKARIEDALGTQVTGFRAPGYRIDYESLELVGEAGYRYDSSIFPN